MSDWWSELDTAVLECLKDGGPMTPDEVAGRLGMPEPAVISLLCMLAKTQRVRIRLVESIEPVDTRQTSWRIEPGYADTVLTAG